MHVVLLDVGFVFMLVIIKFFIFLLCYYTTAQAFRGVKSTTPALIRRTFATSAKRDAAGSLKRYANDYAILIINSPKMSTILRFQNYQNKLANPFLPVWLLFAK
jgi:hypothetical protein